MAQHRAVYQVMRLEKGFKMSKKQAKIEVTNDDEAMAMRREALRVRNEGLL